MADVYLNATFPPIDENAIFDFPVPKVLTYQVVPVAGSNPKLVTDTLIRSLIQTATLDVLPVMSEGIRPGIVFMSYKDSTITVSENISKHLGPETYDSTGKLLTEIYSRLEVNGFTFSIYGKADKVDFERYIRNYTPSRGSVKLTYLYIDGPPIINQETLQRFHRLAIEHGLTIFVGYLSGKDDLETDPSQVTQYLSINQDGRCHSLIMTIPKLPAVAEPKYSYNITSDDTFT